MNALAVVFNGPEQLSMRQLPLTPPSDDDVVGCVYIYPAKAEEWDVTVQSWVRADRSELDVPLADAVARWLATDWPWERLYRYGR